MCGAFVPPANVGAERDWYAITAAGGDRITATMTLTNANGNLDLYLLNSIGTVLASSTTTTGTETITFNIAPAAGGTYFIRVDPGTPVDADARNTYSLNVTSAPPPSCADDAFEQNDTAATATPVTLPFNNTTLVMCGAHVAPDNVGAEFDFYSFNLAAGDRITPNITLTNANGNLDVTLVSPSGVDVAASWTTSGTETLSYTVPTGAAGNYKVRVEPWNPVDSDARNTYSSAFTVTAANPLPNVLTGCSAPLCVSGTPGAGPNGGTVLTYTIPPANIPTSNSIGFGVTAGTQAHNTTIAPNRFCTSSTGTSADLILQIPVTGFTRFAATTCLGTTADSVLAAFTRDPLLGGSTTVDGGGLCNDTSGAPGATNDCSSLAATAVPPGNNLFIGVTGYGAAYWNGSATRTFSVELIP
jgi:hypothetical protein